MPCWYYEKKDLSATPSHRDGIDDETEARYRREGARFIMDTGTKMGLSFDTCATGVVYFHRFYMFHSFRTFHRFVTAACCLFLAGKVEETPKKCKDIIKITRATLTDAQFIVFGEDPKEEVMTLERILLQTIKFDLQVEHPYGFLLKYAKLLKGDKAKIQKMVQMAWTFINDSLCTTLCLQWEPEIIAVALIYLASRLSKFEITDWHGRTPNFRGKWWDALVEGLTLELLEDICHHVLDLYSKTPSTHEDSPPPPPPKPIQVITPQASAKRSRSPVPRPTEVSAPKQTRVDDRRPHSPRSAADKQRVTQPTDQMYMSTAAVASGHNFSSSSLSSNNSQTIQSRVVGSASLPATSYSAGFNYMSNLVAVTQPTFAAGAAPTQQQQPVTSQPYMMPTATTYTTPTYQIESQYTQQYQQQQQYTAPSSYMAGYTQQPYSALNPTAQVAPTQFPAQPPPPPPTQSFTQYPAPTDTMATPTYFNPMQGGNFRAQAPPIQPQQAAAPSTTNGMPVVRITGRRN